MAKSTNGVIYASGAKEVTQYSQCLTDTFSVTSSAGNSPPVICGSNAGKHSTCNIEFVRDLTIKFLVI